MPPLSPDDKHYIEVLISQGVINPSAWGIQTQHEESDDSSFQTASAWPPIADRFFASPPPSESSPLDSLLYHASTARSTRPSARWLKTASQLMEAAGQSLVLRAAYLWFDAFVTPSRWPRDGDADGIRELPASPQLQDNTVRGLLWCSEGLDDIQLVRGAGRLAEAGFKKVPGHGPRSLKVANAAVAFLGVVPGMEGVLQLARLRQRVILPQAKRLIDHHLDAAAARLGTTRADLDDLAVPTFDLVDGRATFAFAPFTAELAVKGTTEVEIRWLDASGKVRRSEPADVKKNSREERSRLKSTADDLRKNLSAQRDRFERFYLADRWWKYDEWRERYLEHPLLSILTHRLIWSFDNDSMAERSGAWLKGQIVDADDDPVVGLDSDTRVRLWHPIQATTLAALAWQDWLDRHQVRQPFKQAHREVYVLTEAEIATETYSNRFAAHILRQQQFRALAHACSWEYKLMGWFDFQSTPTLMLTNHNLAAEYIVEPVREEIYTGRDTALFIATDQVRFRRPDDTKINLRGIYGTGLQLREIPAMVFSEVMRDVDLFVGVASVGADASWDDQGPEHVHAYWETYAIAELAPSGNTRRAVLERLIPQLSIASQCELEERHLVVRGKLRTYRIHLGSGNIQMEPDNQYLCIVPSRISRDDASAVFLPFEGDRILSTIISKAFLLSKDEAITDPTITRQLAKRT